MVSAIQVWNPDEWEAFALSLLQNRHGVLNVHKIPAAHKGDFGIDYYCTSEAVAYQCYAVVEPIDISTRAERQKRKITIDTGKFVKNENEIKKLFLGKGVKHWRLLVPLHDSKEVNLHCADKTLQIRMLSCAHLDNEFDVGIDDQKSFAPSAIAAGMTALTQVALEISAPTPAELSKWQAGSTDLLENARRKLVKRTGPKGLEEAVAEAMNCLLQGNSALDALRSNAPDLHEKVIGAVSTRVRRLSLAGSQGGPTPNLILNTEIDHLNAAIKAAAPKLADDLVEQIALGSVSDWIMRCPLDF
ncbi:hypothetical protein [Bradyrhizobium sp. sBnM-33]|uniref:hypothetical protein n=1 Tax=Bradyrhizobium sp. sBnM-33 TaxID=2831780 RepID=UPI001BCB7AEB|nr:hypothetical protein [Bradyrhizobium sp. sBnM-33]WOH50557.1 hypothetical protein RX328_42220 [Bradyrhizobium sp. sBnM-33]